MQSKTAISKILVALFPFMFLVGPVLSEPAAVSDNAKLKQKILNGYCCVPNMSSGYKSMKLINGKATEGESEVIVSNITFGKLDEKPVAVARLEYSGGGSGVFNSLMLYELKPDRVATVGSYAFGDRPELVSLRFENGKIALRCKGSVPSGFKSKSVTLKRGDFEKVECLDCDLSAQIKADLDSMVALYEAAGKLTPTQKKSGLEICERHKNNRAFFTRAVRLQLEAAGWGPGPSPLQFDKSGRPSIYVDSKNPPHPLF